jgi:hypothetical protein
VTKTFKSVRSKRPPLDFELEYEKMIDGDWVEQTDKFKARPMVSGHLLMQIATAMESGVAIQSAEMIKLLNSAITPEDKDRFMTLIDDNDVAIPIETLGEILAWLAEEYTGNPTKLV